MKLAPSLRLFSAALLSVTVLASAAFAVPLRSPQIVVNGGSLQGYLNSQGETINVNTDQLDAQVFSTGLSGNSTFTLMIELAGNAPNNTIGIYNIDDPNAVPVEFQVFPGAASAGWHALAHFGNAGSLVVTLFDDNGNFQGQTGYAGVSRTRFGFYLDGPGGKFYSDDSRNAGGAAQVLTYASTLSGSSGEWWECFEDLAPGNTDNDFDDAVLLIESVAATPTTGTTWGALKRLYR